ncbi:hypothetical protein [Novosphingobium sp. FKTRR1]|uniref:hypothetical protein n=1 Tax=Novosphingobium sp. FKTRR1 TaxID=2879118 RepID=UPI001CEFBF3A|nr:hypothetical protein [Novosphingobium sp. FKTRR1]
MLSDKIFRITLEATTDNRWFAYVMGASCVRLQIRNAISGADGLANNLPQSALKAFVVALPPLDEQLVISQHIASISVRSDSLITQAQSAITLLQERRAALISAAVTGKIDVRTARGLSASTSAQVAELPPLRSVVGSYAILRFGKLGRMVIMKLGYLAEAHAGLDLGGHYVRDAAGPYDRNLRDAMEHGAAAVYGIATKEPTKDGEAVTYTIPTSCHAPHDELTALVGTDRAAAFEAMLAKLKGLNRDNIEAIATLYAVWNDLLADGKRADDALICAGVLNCGFRRSRACIAI